MITEQRAGSDYDVDAVFGVGMELLRLAEDIDPERLSDAFWTAVSLHPGPGTIGAWTPDYGPPIPAERLSLLTLLLSLYTATPNLPAPMMEPVFQYLERQIEFPPGSGTRGVIMAMALTDPERAVDWAAKFHEKLRSDGIVTNSEPWIQIGRTLTNDRRSIAESITRDVFQRQVIK